MMDWEWNHGWGFMHGFGGMFGALFWIFLILGIVALVRWLNARSGETSLLPPKEKSALEILDERFARGEIDQQEYEQKRQILKKKE